MSGINLAAEGGEKVSLTGGNLTMVVVVALVALFALAVAGYLVKEVLRADQGTEKMRVTILYLPAEKYDAGKTPRPSRGARKHARTIRIRARIEGFDRERYRIGPRWTAGWLARVQQLAPVVATAGTIDVSLFAMEPEAP